MSKIDEIKKAIRDAVNTILPPQEVNLDEVKDDVWRELSNLYYKYEDDKQKEAFREVIQEISERMSEGKWRSVYGKLYRMEKESEV